MEEPTCFRDLGIPCIINVFSRLNPTECATAACVCQLWAQVAADDSLWRSHLAADFATPSCINYDASEAASYKSAYSSWRVQYADVYGPMLTRSLAAWAQLRAWLKAHSPRILASLRPPATAAELAAAEAKLGHPLPDAMRAIYRVHDGQSLNLEQQSCEEGPPPDLLMGLFGTTAFYDHVTSTQLMRLDQVVGLTRLLRGQRPLGAGQTMLRGSEVLFGHSFRITDKMFVVDCNTGAVALKHHACGRDWPLAPPTDTYPGAFDGMLRWFEEYASRMSAGVYGTCAGESGLADVGLHETEAISLFPRTYPYAATAITRGVKVTWSSVMVPQDSRQGRLMFAYCVRYSLLTQQQQQEALLQLAAEEAAWQQRQQQQQQQQQAVGSNPADDTSGGGFGGDRAPEGPAVGQAGDGVGGRDVQHPTSSQPAAAAAAAAAGPSSGSAASKPYRQSLVLGACAASAGPAAVPEALAVQAPWKAAAAAASAAAAGSSGSGSSAAAGSGESGAGDAAAAATPTSCQLESRHWVMFNPQGSELDRVDGEGVVGLYPLLYPGNSTPFAYASCNPCPVPDLAREAAGGAGGAGQQPHSAQSEASSSSAAAAAAAGQGSSQQQAAQGEQGGSSSSSSSRWQTGPGRLAGCVVGCMEGSFSFVEGSLMQRSGGPFQVVCPRLVFAVPEYIF